MRCRKCGDEFEPVEEIQDLILSGKVDQTCVSCCKVAIKPLMPPKSSKINLVRGLQSQLYRVDWFNPDETVTHWIALPPRFPRLNRGRPRRMGRRDDNIYAFVMSMSAGRHVNTPHLVLRHNYNNFQRLGQPLRIEKIPSFQCPLTGGSGIIVPVGAIASVEDTGGLLVVLAIKGGGRVQMKFRNT